MEALTISFPEVTWKLFDPSAPEEDNFALKEIIYPDNFKIIKGTLPSKSVLESEAQRLQEKYAAQDYARQREPEYPSIEECIHAILDDDLVALQAKRQIIKDKYPKPTA